MIINEYQPGQGISKHIDLETFGEPVISLSLRAPTMMEFLRDAEEKVEIWIEPGTVLVLTGPSRWDWMHQIRKRRSDTLPGAEVVLRGRRVSVTFRKVQVPRDQIES